MLCLLSLPASSRLRLTFYRRLSSSVCLSLLATSCKNYRSDLRQTFTRDVFVDKIETIKVRKLSASRSGYRNFKGFFSALRDRTFFHDLFHISGKTDRIAYLWKIRHRRIFGEVYRLLIWSELDWCRRRCSLSVCCCIYLHFAWYKLHTK